MDRFAGYEEHGAGDMTTLDEFADNFKSIAYDEEDIVVEEEAPALPAFSIEPSLRPYGGKDDPGSEILGQATPKPAGKHVATMSKRARTC